LQEKLPPFKGTALTLKPIGNDAIIYHFVCSCATLESFGSGAIWRVLVSQTVSKSRRANHRAASSAERRRKEHIDKVSSQGCRGADQTWRYNPPLTFILYFPYRVLLLPFDPSFEV
jgi:hypothetical protein